MFYGEYRHSLDQKGRLIMPSKLREICTDHSFEKFYVTRGLDKCIFMFTDEEWSLQEQKFKSVSFTRKESRHFNRMFFSGAQDVTLDKQGRFHLPQYLKDYAEISKDTVIIGVSNRLEIWDRQKWDAFYDETSGSFEEIAESFLNL